MPRKATLLACDRCKSRYGVRIATGATSSKRQRCGSSAHQRRSAGSRWRRAVPRLHADGAVGGRERAHTRACPVSLESGHALAGNYERVRLALFVVVGGLQTALLRPVSQIADDKDCEGAHAPLLFGTERLIK